MKNVKFSVIAFGTCFVITFLCLVGVVATTVDVGVLVGFLVILAVLIIGSEAGW